MNNYRFTDEKGSFTLEGAENYSYLYFPIAGEEGIKSCVTPNLGGDSKLDQNQFLLEPVSAENLHNNRSGRNFWCHVGQMGNWSAVGNSAEAENAKFTDLQEESHVDAGLMWHSVTRESRRYQLRAEVVSFVPVRDNVEIMQVQITNCGQRCVTFTPTAAIPIYGRSAANIRDHRHVTSLLHRIETVKEGVQVRPTLSFDERGHQKNETTYFVYGVDQSGQTPISMFPVVEDFIGEGGNLERPLAVVRNEEGVQSGEKIEGLEAMGGLRFADVTLEMGESVTYTILIGATTKKVCRTELVSRYDSCEKVNTALEETKAYWQDEVNVSYQTADKNYDNFMKWVSFQPILRRIYGCSFLPHHDYGKGGRGWRDLWQDCLALLIMNPDGVRQMLIDNFAGVRVDGTNATIIGDKQGEFLADRNNITRVWMDHGVWPWMTTRFYIDQTGDLELLTQKVSYFKDKQVMRGTAIDDMWSADDDVWQQTIDKQRYQGTILEHLLIQNLTAFYEVGEHNHIRLRDADWNDAIDMASDRGESVAFTNAYAGNMKELAAYIRLLGKTNPELEVAEELNILLTDQDDLYESPQKKTELLATYTDKCRYTVSGARMLVTAEEVADSLEHKAEWMMEHIRKSEWLDLGEQGSWFNGYYDNHGQRVEGIHEGDIRMMLTGQVFSIMSGTATEEQIEQITKSADRYLYDKNAGGYRLNTNFHEVKMDMGRMFGFSYGDKENGAVFSHMAVMYGNALYTRGHAREGYKALSALAEQSLDFKKSRIYPGIPEYFNARGRGMYHYLTGAASWYMMTVITQMFGVKGELGSLLLEPKLVTEQFDEDGTASLELWFQGRKWKVIYHNPQKKDYGAYEIKQVTIDGKPQGELSEKRALIPEQVIKSLDQEHIHIAEIVLQ